MNSPMKFFLFFLLILCQINHCKNEDNIIFNNTIKDEVDKVFKDQKPDFGVFKSMLESFLVLLVSEIGDKTFFLCVIFSTKLQYLTVIIISFISLFLMNMISIVLGYLIPVILYQKLMDWLSIYVFIMLGYKLIQEGNEQEYFHPLLQLEDQDESDQIIERKIHRVLSAGILTEPLMEVPIKKRASVKNLRFRSKVNLINLESIYQDVNEDKIKYMIWSLFSSLIVAHCCGGSQISLIVMSSVFDIYGVLIGATFGIIICIIFSVYFGSYIGKHLSAKLISYIRGTLLLLIAIQILLKKLSFI